MILGGSKIGINTAKELCEKKFRVILLNKINLRPWKLMSLCLMAMVIHGDGRSSELLDEEAIESMDAFISVTENSEPT